MNINEHIVIMTSFQGRRCLIPLKSLEKQDTMKAGRLAMTAPEKSKLVSVIHNR